MTREEADPKKRYRWLMKNEWGQPWTTSSYYTMDEVDQFDARALYPVDEAPSETPEPLK